MSNKILKSSDDNEHSRIMKCLLLQAMPPRLQIHWPPLEPQTLPCFLPILGTGICYSFCLKGSFHSLHWPPQFKGHFLRTLFCLSLTRLNCCIRSSHSLQCSPLLHSIGHHCDFLLVWSFGWYLFPSLDHTLLKGVFWLYSSLYSYPWQRVDAQ